MMRSSLFHSVKRAFPAKGESAFFPVAPNEDELPTASFKGAGPMPYSKWWPDHILSKTIIAMFEMLEIGNSGNW